MKSKTAISIADVESDGNDEYLRRGGEGRYQSDLLSTFFI